MANTINAGQGITGGVTLNPTQAAAYFHWLNNFAPVAAEFLAIMSQTGGTMRPGTTRTRTIGTRRNVQRAASGSAGVSPMGEKLLTWAKESGKPFSISEAVKAGIGSYNSVAKLCGQLVERHNLGKSGRGVYQLGTH